MTPKFKQILKLDDDGQVRFSLLCNIYQFISLPAVKFVLCSSCHTQQRRSSGLATKCQFFSNQRGHGIEASPQMNLDDSRETCQSAHYTANQCWQPAGRAHLRNNRKPRNYIDVQTEAACKQITEQRGSKTNQTLLLFFLSQVSLYLYSPVSQITICLKGLYNMCQHSVLSVLRLLIQIMKKPLTGTSGGGTKGSMSQDRHSIDVWMGKELLNTCKGYQKSSLAGQVARVNRTRQENSGIQVHDLRYQRVSTY